MISTTNEGMRVRLLKTILSKLSVETVYAHCDIPCGIYSIEPARIAASAAARMTEGITKLPTKGSNGELLTADNNFTRMVLIKEREAQRCKEELLILWTDFFKPEHLAKWPKLHDTFWLAAKQCSAVKREVSADEAAKLVKAVDVIAHIFAEASKK